MRFSFEIHLCLPRDVVFQFLADPAHRPRWQTSIQTFEMEPQGEPRVGVRWRESVRGAGTFEMEISEYERPTRWAERIDSKAFAGTVAMTFGEAPGGTTLRLDADVRCRGAWRLVAPIARIALRREMRKDLKRVEALLSSA